MSVDIKETQEEIKKSLVDFQKAHTELSENGTKTNESLEKMKEEFVKLSEEYQETKLALDAEVKAREALELATAKVSEDLANGEEVKSNPEYKHAFNEYVRTRKMISDDAINEEFKQLTKTLEVKPDSDRFLALKTLVVGSNPDGGFLVPVEMQSKIIERVFETSPMRSISTVITTSTEAVEYVLDDGEFESGWVGEVDSRPDTETSKIGIITIPINEIYAYPKASQKMLDDAAFPVESWLTGKISSKFAREENTGFVTGNAAKVPEGFMSLPDWTTLAQYERGALETRETATANVIAAVDLIQLQTDLLEPYQLNANWAFQRKTWATIMSLQGTNNTFLLDPMLMFRNGADLQILGKPVVLMADMPADDTEGNVPIAYGDFREGYVIADRIGIRILRDPYTTKGYVKFYATKRTGGKTVNYQAIKRLKIQAT
jgi:HK97 family phage major capsid protein